MWREITVKIYLFVCLWLCWVFIAVRIFSSCGEQRATLYSQGSGFSLRRLLLLRRTGSRAHGLQWLHRVGPLVGAPGLRSTGSIDWCTGLAALCRRIFPGQGVNLETEDYIFVSSLPAFPGGSEVKASAPNARDVGSIPGSGRCPGEGNGNPLQYSCLENAMDGDACWLHSPRGCKESDTTERLHISEIT